PDVNHSGWDSTLEIGPCAADRLHELHNEMRADIRATQAIRLGLREIKGLKEEDARLIVERRAFQLAPHFLSLPPLEKGRSDGEAGRVGINSNVEQKNDPHPDPPPFRGRENAGHNEKE